MIEILLESQEELDWLIHGIKDLRYWNYIDQEKSEKLLNKLKGIQKR